MTKNENLLITLSEECAEVQQAVSKLLRFGNNGCINFEKPNENNEYNIMLEYYQLIAVMEILNENGVLKEFSEEEKNNIIKNKKEKVKYYQEISIKNGYIK